MTFNLGRVESIVEKGENAGYQHFLLFPQCFQKAPIYWAIKSCDCVVKSEALIYLDFLVFFFSPFHVLY